MNRRFGWMGAVLGTVLGLAGCVMPQGGAPGGEVTANPGQGLLEVRWTGEGRSVLGSTWAAANADAYELLLLGAAGPRAYPLAAGSGQVLSVDPGTYEALVLAGVKRSSGSTTAYLVGSALATGVVVEVGKRTAVNLVLRSIDLTLGLDGPAYWKGALTLKAGGKSRNSHLGMSLAGASTTARPRLKSVELWNGYREMATVTGTPDDWAATATALGPASGDTARVDLIGASLVYLGLDGQWAPTTGLTTLAWAWANRAEVADNHPLADLSSLIVALGPPPTGVEVGLIWE